MKPFAQAALKGNSLNFAGGSHNGGPGRWVIICGVTSTAALPVTGTNILTLKIITDFATQKKNVKFLTFFFFPIYQIVFSRFAQLPYFFFFFPFFFFNFFVISLFQFHFFV